MGIHNNAVVGASGQQGYQISRSVRLRSSASAYFNRTAGTPTNANIWTWSAWVKRGTLTTRNTLFSGGSTNVNYISFGDSASTDNFGLTYANSPSQLVNVQSTAVFRDPSAWHHLMVVYDSTSATGTITGSATDRVRLYVNGVQITSFSATTPPTQNTSVNINAASAVLNLGRRNIASPDSYFDGYMTEVNFIDGQALTPSSFGETNAITGVWKPKKYGGTYGTNGFYLNFSDNSASTAATIGKDYSGNGNNWTPNIISVSAGVTYDSMTDSPTVGPLASNFATWNPLRKDNNASISLANGNLAASGTTYPSGAFLSTIAAQTSGLFYAEFTLVGAQWPTVAVADVTVPNICPSGSMSVSGVVAWDNANYFINGATVASGLTMNSADVIGVAFDAATRKVWFAQNNTWVSSGNPAAGTNERGTVAGTGALAFACRAESTVVIHANFGQRPFSYTPPSGFVALNTQNLPAPTISNGALHMASNLWTANVASPTTGQKSIAVGFQPDLVWSKNRSDAESHYWVDSVRGDNSGSKWLRSSSTAAEGTDAIGSSTAKYVFTSTGFDIVDTDSTVGEVYYTPTSRTYVGWAWKAGGTAVTNTNGTISSQVSANPTAGFSVLTYTGTGANATVGHGLGVAPNMVITKRRNLADGWVTFHTSLTSAAHILSLQAVGAQTSSATVYNSMTTRNSTVYSIGTDTSTNTSTATYVAYCFAAVAGYSAFGGYTGNGATDGVFVFLGFRARFLMIKRTDSTGGWVVLDTARDTYNDVDNYLYANSTAVDAGSSNVLDINSNGFKIRNSWTDINASGGTYIYMAFAENPFKYSNAR